MPYVECQGRFALSFVAAVELQDAVFDRQSRQRSNEWLLVEHIHIQPAIRHIGGFDFELRRRSPRGALVERRGVGTGRFEVCRDARLVVNFDEKHAPALFVQLRGRGAARDFHAAFGIDVHADKHAVIKRLLNRLHRFGVICLLQRRLENSLFGRREAFAQKVERGYHTADLSLKRLGLDVCNKR